MMSRKVGRSEQGGSCSRSEKTTLTYRRCTLFRRGLEFLAIALS